VAISLVLQLALAAALFVLGRWGRLHGESLVPRSLPGEHRTSRLNGLRRGGLACQVLGVAFALAVIPSLL
jgi:hypothetical protein